MPNTEFKYTVTEPIAVLYQKGASTKEINLVSYNDKEPQYDIRHWQLVINRNTGEENKLLRKGIALTLEEAKTLKAVLNSRPEL